MIFVDYGSETSIATEIENLITSYKFTKYIYSDTRGWFWNRAHALNTGARLAKGSVLLFFDIDILLEASFLEKINTLSFKESFYTFSCYYLPENFKYDNAVLERDGIHYEQNYVGICAVSREAVEVLNGYDEYFMVWGAEDDDFYESLKQSGINHLHQPLSLYKVFHQWHKTQAPPKPTMWYLQMVQYLSIKKYVQKEKNDNWGKLISQSDCLINNELNNLKWDLELHVSSETGYLLFNPLIDAINNPSFKQIYFEFTYVPKKTKRRKWFKFHRTESTNNIAADISSKDVLDFVQYFIGIFRQILADYSLTSNYKTIKLGLVKYDESL
jgi:hypothetical protein